VKDRASDIFDLIADVVIARQSEWRDHAACKGYGAETFFPKQSNPLGYLTAKAICDTCKVHKECRKDWSSMPAAMQRHGVWWETTDRDRKAQGL
jgi:hypothetical protein